MGAIALPHVVRLERVPPPIAVAIWGSGLALRALTGLAGALYLLAFLPQTALFAALTHWCWHTALPLLATHLGLDGHELGDTAVVMPSFFLAASVLWVAFGIVRAARSVRTLLERGAVGTGPANSVIVGGADVLVAAAGFSRPRVVVSAGALTAFDDEELAAGLAHERGHIARGHRFVLLCGELARGLARFLPGTRRALSELSFHLERDADHWALARRHDPFALASAICKAATPHPTLSSCGVTALSGGGRVGERLAQLLDGRSPRLGSLRLRLLHVAASAMVLAAVGFAVLLPATAAAGLRQAGEEPELRHCAR